VKAEILRTEIPSRDEIQRVSNEKVVEVIEAVLQGKVQSEYTEIADRLAEKGYSPQNIAAAVLQLYLANDVSSVKIAPIASPEQEVLRSNHSEYAKKTADIRRPQHNTRTNLIIDIGSAHQAGVNHIVGAMKERTGLAGYEIGKISISPEHTIVEIPSERCDEVLQAMIGLKICGRTVKTAELAETYGKRRNASRPSESSRSSFSPQYSHRPRG
jgi:ATP-dependent RNA helicase DeaD